jgi:hypothetical protein
VSTYSLGKVEAPGMKLFQSFMPQLAMRRVRSIPLYLTVSFALASSWAQNIGSNFLHCFLHDSASRRRKACFLKPAASSDGATPRSGYLTSLSGPYSQQIQTMFRIFLESFDLDEGVPEWKQRELIPDFQMGGQGIFLNRTSCLRKINPLPLFTLRPSP